MKWKRHTTNHPAAPTTSEQDVHAMLLDLVATALRFEDHNHGADALERTANALRGLNNPATSALEACSPRSAPARPRA